MTCVHCRAELHRGRGRAPFHADRAGYHLQWDAIPAWLCPQCGEALFERQEVDAIQAALSLLDSQTRHFLDTDASTAGNR